MILMTHFGLGVTRKYWVISISSQGVKRVERGLLWWICFYWVDKDWWKSSLYWNN